MKDFFDALVATKPVLNPSVLPEFPLGPMVKAWVESDTYAGGDNAIESILYGKPIVKSDVDRWRTNAQFIPGCTLGGVIGPGHHRDVMVVGSIPRGDLGSLGTIKPLDGMLGDGKDVLIKALEEVGISERRWKNFYITNMVRFPRLDGGKTKTMYAEWINECKHFLAQELYLIKPRLILCLGTDSSKFFSGFPVTKAQSRVFTYDIGELHKAKVVCSLDPVKVIDNFEMRPSMISSLHLFSDLLHRRSRKTEEGSYFYIDSEEELEVVVDELIAAGHTEFSLDCEWGGGSHFYDQNSALRTVQIAWSGAEGMVVILHRQFMKEAFNPYITSAMYHLRRLLQRPGVRVIGHALCADIPWMKEYGVDLTGQIYFDTMLAGHLLEPTASHELESLAVRYIKNWTRHDFELADWMKKNKIDLNLGYSEIPDEILHPYAVKDACATFYLYQYYVKELALGRNTSLRRLFYSLVMPAIPSFVEIEMNGIYMDRERLIRMEKQYRAKFDTLLAEFRLTVGNPNFNPNSYTDKSKLVFDEHGFYPIKTTGKYPKEWLDVVARREEDKYSPAVDDETLETFAHKSPVMHKLRDICLIGTVLKNFLKSQEIDPHTGERRYMTGLIGHTKSTGCLHTRISQMLKTGRLASHDPNIMNMPNRQEPAIRAAVGPGVPIIRSGFMAEPGHLLITADYKQAEIAALAYLSGDPLLIAAVVRGDDIHSTVGRKMFNMEHLTNDEFKEQFKHLRVAAKSILFGYRKLYRFRSNLCIMAT